MKTISVVSWWMERFKSFEKKETIELPAESSLILFAGINEAEPRLGANGAGKTSAFDALCFVLTGLSTKGARINDLVTRGQKSVSAGVMLIIDGAKTELVRSGPPERIFIDGRRVEQTDVERLVGMSRQRILNSVLYGQGTKLFIDLSIPERGAILDEMLDLQVWLSASDRAGNARKKAETDLNYLRVDIGRVEGALSALESLDDIVRSESQWDADRDEQVNALLAEFEEKELALTKQGKAAAASGSVVDIRGLEREIDGARKKLSLAEKQVAVSEQEAKRLRADIAFFGENTTCPVCAQNISAKFASQRSSTLGEHLSNMETDIKAGKAKIAAFVGEINATAKRIDAARLKAQEAAQEVAAFNSALAAENRALDALESRIQAIAEQTNPYSARRGKIEADRANLEEKMAALRVDETLLNNRLAVCDFWRDAFKRVRLNLIGRILQELDIDTMNAASSLGLIGWRISFTTEMETRAGTVKSGVQVAVKSPKMAGAFIDWSGGEGHRVRLCTALGFAALIQRLSGVWWDIEILDEQTHDLSETGVADLFDLLKMRADTQRKRILIADHVDFQHAAIDRVITIVKDDEGSRVMEGRFAA